MFHMMGVFAEFRERVMAGPTRAREDGERLGRRPIEVAEAKKAAAIRQLLSRKVGIRRIARELSAGIGTIIRIRDAPAGAS